MTELEIPPCRDVAYPDSVGMIISKDGVDEKIYRPGVAFHYEDGVRVGHLIKKPKDDRIKPTEPEPGYAPPAWSGLYNETLWDFLRPRRSYYDEATRWPRHEDYAYGDAQHRAEKDRRADARETARYMKTNFGFVTPETAAEHFRTIINVTDPKGGEAGDQHA